MKINYRPEIDGLRAIAVGVVILYHAEIYIFGYQPFKGGFIGVDIFLVISGYLITSIILKELNETGTFSYKYFYERRIRRIIPALTVVMLASLPFAWLYLLPSELIDYSKSILFSLGFNSNFYFHFSGLEYGTHDGLLKPFLHTWSLSVEEQYYILFPIILLITFKYFKKHLFSILTVGILTSLFIADWGSKNYPSFNFYILPTRAWELGIGSLLAYFEISNKRREQNIFLGKTLPFLGLLLIIHSVVFFDDNMFHPSFFTLSPIFGVCFIIWFSNKDEIIYKILSSKLFVGIGLISYSLYLWHYPIFAFARIAEYPQGEAIVRIFIIISLIILSISSYYFVERPARNRIYDFRKIFIILISGISILITLNIFSIVNKGKLHKSNTEIESKLASPLHESECKFSTDNVNFMYDKIFNQKINNCKKEYNNFILILGDSHSIDLFNSVANFTKKIFIVGLNRGRCRPWNNSTEEGISKGQCHYQNALEFIKNNNNNLKYIIFTHRGSYFLTNGKDLPIYKKQFEETVDYITKLNKIVRVIYIGPTIEPNIDLRSLRTAREVFSGNYMKYKDLNNDNIIKVDKKLNETFTNLGIKYISKIEKINFNLKSDYLINGKVTYSDKHHWSQFGETYFGEKLINNSILKDLLN